MKRVVSRLAAVLLPLVLLLSAMVSAASAADVTVERIYAIWDVYGLSENDYYAQKNQGLLTPFGQLDVKYALENEVDGSYTLVDVPYIYRDGSTAFHNYITGQDCAITGVQYDDVNEGYDIVLNDGSSWCQMWCEFGLIIEPDIDEDIEPDVDEDFEVYYHYVRVVGGSQPDPGPVDPGGSGSGSGDAEQPEGLWGKLTDLIGIVLDGIIGIIERVFQKLFDALKALIGLLKDGLGSVVDSVLSIFRDVPAMFPGFFDFLSLLFPFIPSEMITLLIFSFVAAVIVGVIKAVRR